MSSICEGIRTRRLLAFRYEGLPRVVAPYCHGMSSTGRAVLRALQVGGQSRSGRLGTGKLWLLDKVIELDILDQPFVPDDPDYNPDDSAMRSIHCRV